ncbi:MAG: hypothetical protein ACE5EL_06760, partial [Anaerolineae bacterium]
ALHPSHGPSPSPVACTGLAPRGAAGFVACNPVNGVRVPGSVGLPLPGVAVRITDDRGFDLSPGSAGHLEVRAANLSCPDRWLRLDGAAWVDEAGFVYLAPRGQMNPGQMALGRGRETRAVDVGAGVGDAAPGFDGRP